MAQYLQLNEYRSHQSVQMKFLKPIVSYTLVSSLAGWAVAAAVPRRDITCEHQLHLSPQTFICSPIQVRRNAVNQTTQGNALIPVVVGGPQDLFVPNQVRARVGDVVQFQFSSGNHTVTQSRATDGCQPLQATDPGAVHSGHIPFQSGQTEVGTFSMVVQSAEPMFLYCATGPHCQTGQVMVINPYV